MRIHLERHGVLMERDPLDPREDLGVLNPASARGPDGELYLFPRVVAAGNYSRIGIARVRHDRRGRPGRVERLGFALEPQEAYESLGVEDPRVSRVACLADGDALYLMTYTAYSPVGPRLALAVSEDLFCWRRLGLARFEPWGEHDVNAVMNKDGAFFPELIRDPYGRLAVGLIHRPSLPGMLESIWLSYADAVDLLLGGAVFRHHHLLAGPETDWEHLKIGGGAPPVRLSNGHWLLLYHGVSGRIVPGVQFQQHMHYRAGMLVLEADDPRQVRFRNPEPVFAPEEEHERHGIVPNVVFPTGVDVRGDDCVDVFYGMADSRIGSVRLVLHPLTASCEGCERAEGAGEVVGADERTGRREGPAVAVR